MVQIINLPAFCLPIFLFSYWSTVGYATLSLLRSQRYTLQNLLLAPAIGFAVTLFPIFWLNRLGLPINQFAILLAICLFAGSVFILYWKKPFFPVSYYFPFGLILFVALCLIGSPLLKFGFDWLSFGNDDMTNYALGALRFLKYGYFDIPNLTNLIERKDYSLLYWFTHVPGMVRSGSEIILAWVSGVTHLNPSQVFMPLIVSFHLVLISVTGALVYQANRHYYVALTVLLLLTFSSLTAFGTLYQLLAQVMGLSVLMVSVVLICHSFTVHKKFYQLQQGILIGLILATFLIVYPELLPFLMVSFLAYFAINFWNGWRINLSFCVTALYAILFMVIFLNTHMVAIAEFTFLQYKIVSQLVTMQIVLFPYFLLPSGLANLWGLMRITGAFDEPFMSLVVTSGGLLLFLVIILSFRLAKRASPPAIVAAVMIMVGINLFIKNYGFGLFKLAMFVQPFFLSVIAISLFELIKTPRWRITCVLILILSGISGFFFYLERSKGKTPGSFSEIAYGSTTKVNEEYKKLIASTPKETVLLSDDFNISLIKLQALQSSNYQFITLTSPNDFIVGVLPDAYHLLPQIDSITYFTGKARDLAKRYATNAFYEAQFNLHDTKQTQIDFTENDLSKSLKKANKPTIIITDSRLRSIFNRRYYKTPINYNFALKKWAETHNHLVFIDSSLGRIYHSVIANNLEHLSLFNLERDVTFPHQSMQAIGRYLLMKVFNPTKKVRLVLSMTNTFDGNGSNKLPAAAVIGEKRVHFPIMGRGSARVFSETLYPQLIKNAFYLATDMNREGTLFPSKRKGIMNLYNKDLVIDLRQIVTFARDISLVSDEEYQQLNAPSVIKNFPVDLANQDLEYSGIYEDGWISEDAFFRLKQPKSAKQLVIRGMLPRIDPHFNEAVITILLDGKKFASQKLIPGDFKIEFPVKATIANRKIELHFNHGQKLPKGDDRPVGALLKFIGFS